MTLSSSSYSNNQDMHAKYCKQGVEGGQNGTIQFGSAHLSPG